MARRTLDVAVFPVPSLQLCFRAGCRSASLVAVVAVLGSPIKGGIQHGKIHR
jgi:hypothetical protein